MRKAYASQRAHGGDQAGPRSSVRLVRNRKDVSRALVDVQGFFKNNAFVLKTIAVCRLPSDHHQQQPRIEVYTFRPPCFESELNRRDATTQRWLERHHHRSPWKSGDLNYATRYDVIRRVLHGVQQIYVKGGQKSEWLQPYAGSCEVVDLETLGCPSLQQCVSDLLQRYSDDVWTLVFSQQQDFATRNVLALFNWIREKKKYCETSAFV